MQNALPCICYHSVGTSDGHSIDTFEKHLRYLRDHGFKTLTAKQLSTIIDNRSFPANQKSCVLTFDDCHLSNWLYVIPLLDKYDMHGIFFCITDFIDFSSTSKRNIIDGVESKSLATAFKQATQERDFSNFMNYSEINSTVKDYGMDVFSHSASHKACLLSIQKTHTPQPEHWSVPGLLQPAGIKLPDTCLFKTGSAYANNGIKLSSIRLDDGQLSYEFSSESERKSLCEHDFKKSYDIIKQITGVESDQLFCYPWGQHDELTKECLKNAGYKGAFILSNDQNVSPINCYAVNRFCIGTNRKLPFFMLRIFLQTNKHVGIIERFLRSIMKIVN